MAILQRLKNLIPYNSSPLAQSIGVVTRNYAKAPAFRPRQQVIGITYKAIDKIGQSLSDYQPIVQRKSGAALETHPVLSLFERPNANMTASDFIYLYGMLFEIYGETFWYKARGERSGKPKELHLLNPEHIELRVDSGELIGYVMHKSNGQQVPFTPDEIIHDKRPNPFNEWRGMSVLERAAVYVDTEINTSHFTLNYIRNNASPSGIVGLPDMDREAFKQFTAQWRENYEGPQNAGKTAFIRGGEASFKAVGATLKDIELEKVRNMSKDDVLMMLDVPRPLLGMTDQEGFGRGNIESLYFIFASEKIEPMMRRLDRIYEKLALELTAGQPVEVTHHSPVPEDKEFVHKQNTDLVNVAITVNEVRARMGLQPLPDGDKLMPAARPQGLAAPPKTVRLVKKAPSTPVHKISDEQEAFRSNLVSVNDGYAKKIKRAITRHAEKQEAGVIGRINASSKAYEEWLFSIKDESEAMAEAMLPIMLELMEAQAKDVANFITGELLTISPEMRATVDQNIKQIAGVFNEDTIKALEKTLSEGQTAGESLAKLKKRVEGVYSEVKGYRAERIARTESLRASNMTAEEVYKQNGYSRIEWFINPGACEFCKTFAGRSKEIGGKFNNIGDVIVGTEGNQMRIDYDELKNPPLHPNCACSIIPVDN